MRLLIFSIILIVVTSVGQVPAQSVIAGTEPVPAMRGTVRCYIPVTPALAKAAGFSGEVQIKITINKEGKVTDAIFSEGKDLLKELSLQAARQWQFVPVIKKDKPADANGQIIFRFEANGSVQADYQLSLFQGNDKDPIPPAMLPVTDAEKEWWGRVRIAGREFSAVGKSFSRELTNKKGGIGVSEYEAEKIRSQVFTRYQSSFRQAESKLRDLYEEQKQKSFKAPIPNSFPLLLHVERAFYTERAREQKVTGKIILSIQVSADGTVKVVRIVNGLPEGLNEQAITAAERFGFLPPTKDGVFFSRETKLEFGFDIF